MQAVETALEELRKTASASKRDKNIHEIISRITEYLLLLKSPSPSLQSLGKLSLALRKPLLPLYSAFPQHTLHLSRAILAAIFEDKISSKIADSEIQEQITLWETVQTEILSGILDYLETNETSETKELIAATLYSKLCDLYLPSSVTTGSYTPNALLRTTVYTLLHETTASSYVNQQRLRNPEVLGSKRLGLTLARTTEYLALEALLTLFARLLPSATGKSESGLAKRIAFIREVANSMSDQGIASTEDIVKVLDFTPSTPWEETSVKIIEILSSRISFPQPFHVDSICVGDTTFPQPLPEDRLYVDQKGFLANVDQGNLYETFQVLFSQITGVKLSPDTNPRQHRFMTVTVVLSSPPLVGNSPLVCSDGHPPSMTFRVQHGDTERFMQALRDRDLGFRITRNPKTSKADSSTILDFSSASQNGAPPPSVEEKFKTVEQFIDDLCSEGHIPSDPPIIGDQHHDSRADIAGAHLIQDMKTNVAIHSLGQVQDNARNLPLRVTQVQGGVAGENPLKNAEMHPAHKIIPSESADPGGSPITGNATNEAEIRTSGFSDDEFTVLSALPKESRIQGHSKIRKAILLDPDTDSDHGLGGLKSHAGKDTASMSTAGLLRFNEHCKPEPLQKSDSASRVRDRTKATQATNSSSVSDVSDPETCPLPTEPARLDIFPPITPKGIFPGRRSKGLIDAGDENAISNKRKKISTMKIPEAAFKDDEVFFVKRKREAITKKESVSVIDLTGSVSEFTPRKRQRRQPSEVEEVPSAPPQAFSLAQEQERHDKDQVILDSPLPLRSNGASGKQDSRGRGSKHVNTSLLRAGRNNTKPDKRRVTTDTIRASFNRSRTTSANNDRNQTPQAVHSRKDDTGSPLLTTRNKGTKRNGSPCPTDDKQRGLELDVNIHFNDMSSRPAERDPQESKGATEKRLETAFDVGSLKELSKEPRAKDNSVSASGEQMRIDVTPNKFPSTVIDDSPKFIRVSKGIVSGQDHPKNVISPVPMSTPFKHAVITDWIQDEPLNQSKSRLTSSVKPVSKGCLPAHITTHTSPKSLIATPNHFLNKMNSPPPSPVTSRLQHSVTFASERDSISPINFENDFHRQRNRLLPDTLRPDHRRLMTSSLKGRNVKEDTDYFEAVDKNNYFRLKANKEPCVQDIVDALDKIHAVIVQRVTGKLECIKANVQHGRTVILEEAADNLRYMCAQSADQFNSLVDLENEYGTFCSSLIQGIEDVSTTQNHIRQQLYQTIQGSDRHTLSKKFPHSLFTGSLDDLFHDLSCLDRD